MSVTVAIGVAASPVAYVTAMNLNKRDCKGRVFNAGQIPPRGKQTSVCLGHGWTETWGRSVFPCPHIEVPA